MTRQPWDQGAERSRTMGLSSAWAFWKAASDHSNQRTPSEATLVLDFRTANGAAALAAAAKGAAHSALRGRAEVEAEDRVLLGDLLALALGADDLLRVGAQEHLEAVLALLADVLVGGHRG